MARDGQTPYQKFKSRIFMIRKTVQNILLFLAVFSVVAAIFLFGFFHSRDGTEPGQAASSSDLLAGDLPLFTLVTPYSFVADILGKVGGPVVDVSVVGVPATGGISAAQYGELRDADALFVLDETADAWAIHLVEEANHIRVVRLSDGVSDFPQGERYYYWLSPDKMGNVVRFIARTLGDMDPVHTVQYLDNAYAYAYDLDSFSQTLSESLGGARRFTFNSAGSGFSPFIQEYKFTFGKNIGTKVENVSAYLSAHPREYVFTDVLFPASAIKDESIRRRIITMDPYGLLFSGDTYVDFLNNNVGRLLEL